ncbi:MAG: hypothetical protein CL840_16250 [Crocinitomicaceae bacterium]|nr:hypothetical protein [Crocinitomicaceae bacterium]|tara:strand:- start:8204 stop:8410 length:207 start_codon:yes stop_codon:yes gene_type:complete
MTEVYAVLDTVPLFVDEFTCCSVIERWEVEDGTLHIYTEEYTTDDPVVSLECDDDEDAYELAKKMCLT